MTRRAKKAGRKRRVDVVRHPGGQPVRRTQQERQADAMATALEARQRLFGLSAAEAKRDEAGDVLGRMLIQDQIQEKQYLAAKEYERLRRAYRAALDAKAPRSASDFSGSGGHDGRDYDAARHEDWYADFRTKCEAAIGAYKNVCGEMLRADPLSLMALHMALDDGKAPTGDVLSGALRVGLNEAARVFRVENWMNYRERDDAA